LESIILGSGVEIIGRIAFQGCSGLENVTFPAGITEIEDMAFDSCGNLQAAYFMGNPPVLGSSVFQGTAAEFMVLHHYNSESCWKDFTNYSTTSFCVITFDSMGGSAIPELLTKVGEVAVCPKPPQFPGVFFDGWYIDPAYKKPWDFKTNAATEDLTLYANWTTALVLSSSDADGKIKYGESFTLTPSIGSGTWNYNNEYLSLSGSTFTAKKSGVVLVSYTVNEQTAEYSITIEENAVDASTIEQDASAPKKQGLVLIASIVAIVAILLSVGLFIVLKNHKHNIDK
jgi:uncharacterized repeat protein (TIGR02543 family)